MVILRIDKFYFALENNMGQLISQEPLCAALTRMRYANHFVPCGRCNMPCALCIEWASEFICDRNLNGLLVQTNLNVNEHYLNDLLSKIASAESLCACGLRYSLLRTI